MVNVGGGKDRASNKNETSCNKTETGSNDRRDPDNPQECGVTVGSRHLCPPSSGRPDDLANPAISRTSDFVALASKCRQGSSSLRPDVDVWIETRRPVGPIRADGNDVLV